jgi:cell wall-associated NlpC family hydrolase
MDRKTFLDHFDSLLVKAGRELEGSNYVWGGKNPAIDGGLDCSGYVRWVQMLVYGKEITIRNAHDQIKHKYLTFLADDAPGTLRFYTDNNGAKYHHVTISLGNGMELNPNGGPENKKENPGKIEEMPVPVLLSHQKVEYRRTNWHYLFFTDNKGQPINYF